MVRCRVRVHSAFVLRSSLNRWHTCFRFSTALVCVCHKKADNLVVLQSTPYLLWYFAFGCILIFEFNYILYDCHQCMINQSWRWLGESVDSQNQGCMYLSWRVSVSVSPCTLRSNKCLGVNSCIHCCYMIQTRNPFVNIWQIQPWQEYRISTVAKLNKIYRNQC